MATCLDIIKAALREIGVLASGETPAAVDAQDALDMLNRMFAAWEQRGVVLGAAFPLGLTDVVPVAAREEYVAIVKLAEMLAAGYGAQVPPAASQMAESGFRGMQAERNKPARVPFERYTYTYGMGLEETI